MGSVGTPAKADPEDKRAIYDELRVDLTHHQSGECRSPRLRMYLGLVSQGGLVSRRDAIRLTRTVSLAA